MKLFGKPSVLKVETYAPTESVEDIADAPIPASKALPDWYKNIPRTSDLRGLVVENGGSNLTVKACLPYLEAMSAGYMVNLWCDIQVTQTNNGPLLNWTSELAPLTSRTPASATGLQRLDGFSEWSFAWNMPWGIKTPAGYSALITHPFNRPDLPFQTVSGITDTDNYAVPGIATFCISNTFEGFIKAGTPILQVIPIKRHDWEIEINQDLKKEEESKRKKIIGLSSGGGYKKSYWVPKSYR